MATPRARLRCSRRRCATATLRKPFRWHPNCRWPLPLRARSQLWCRPDWLARSPTCGSRTRCERLCRGATTGDARAELAGIVTDLYSRLARHRIALKLVDRCAPELPDLAEVWFGTGRNAQVDAVQAYLVHRERAGLLILPGPAPMVARTIVELCALWAVHLHFDPSPEPWSIVQPGVIDDDAIAATLAEFVVRATTASSD